MDSVVFDIPETLKRLKELQLELSKKKELERIYDNVEETLDEWKYDMSAVARSSYSAKKYQVDSWLYIKYGFFGFIAGLVIKILLWLNGVKENIPPILPIISIKWAIPVFGLLIADIIYMIYSRYQVVSTNNWIKKETESFNKERIELLTAINLKYDYYEEQLMNLGDKIDDSEDRITELYNKYDKFLYSKYLQLIPICHFIEYLESGRCDCFAGPYGCYNIFEKESRDDTIIRELDCINENLVHYCARIADLETEVYSIEHNIHALEDDINNNAKSIGMINGEILTLKREQLGLQKEWY